MNPLQITVEECITLLRQGFKPEELRENMQKAQEALAQHEGLPEKLASIVQDMHGTKSLVSENKFARTRLFIIGKLLSWSMYPTYV